MAVALDASTPAAVYNDTLNSSSALTTASFTPPAGSIIVIKVTSADSSQDHGAPTGTGLTVTQRVLAAPANSCTVSLWTAVGNGTATAVTATFTAINTPRGLVVEVFTGAQLAASPVIRTVGPLSGAPSDTITTVAANSVVTWVNGDWSATDGASRAYRSSAVETGYHTLTGQWTAYTAYQAAASAGAQT